VGSNYSVLSIRIGNDIKEKLKKLAKKWGISPSEYTRLLLTLFAEEQIEPILKQSVKNLTFTNLICKCILCDEPFVPNRSDQKFCSHKCGSLHSYYIRTGKENTERTKNSLNSKRENRNCSITES
jgi:hypothetical protein